MHKCWKMLLRHDRQIVEDTGKIPDIRGGHGRYLCYHIFMILCHYICYKNLFNGLMSSIKNLTEQNISNREKQCIKHVGGTKDNVKLSREIVMIVCNFHSRLYAFIYFTISLFYYVLLMVII